MCDALDIARHLIRLGYDPDSPGESVLVCPLRLQKLLYYCQGWALALLGRALFRQPLEAWSHGPVVDDVYKRFAGQRDGLVPDQAGEPGERLSPTEAALVELVWREYACYKPSQLVEMTHAEPAWREARAGLPADAKSSAHLSNETMANYFRGVISKKAHGTLPPGFPVADLAKAWQAEERFDRTGGTGTPAAEVFGRLLAEAGE